MKNSIIKIIKNKFFYSRKTEISEDEYYEKLFIENNKWNTKDPNPEELQRWNVIKNYIEIINQDNELQILDIGCGRGWLTNLLSKYGYAKGIEPIAKVVDYAKKLFPHIDFYKGTSDDLLETKTSFFDLVVSSEVYEHVEDENKDDFVNNINRLLKPNGNVIISTPRKEVQNEWQNYIGANQPVEEWVSEKELEDKFLGNGFKSLGVKRIPYKITDNSFLDIYQVWHFKKES